MGQYTGYTGYGPSYSYFDRSLAQNSGQNTTVASSVIVGPDQTPPSADTTGPGALSPITLTSPMPSITPVRPGTVTTNEPDFWCGVNSWVSTNPWLALAGVAAAYFLLRKKKA